MHLREVYPGYLRITADNNRGFAYRDWRRKYFQKPGVIVIQYLDSEQDKGSAYLFLKDLPGEHLCTSIGDVHITDDTIQIKTVRSLYLLFRNSKCLSDVDMVELKKRAEKCLGKM